MRHRLGRAGMADIVITASRNNVKRVILFFILDYNCLLGYSCVAVGACCDLILFIRVDSRMGRLVSVGI